jgi:GntR family transcriptional regulator
MILLAVRVPAERGSMNKSYPVELQMRLEKAIVEGAYARGSVVTIDELARDLRAADGPLLLILPMAHCKGLVEPLAEEGTYRILGLPTTELSSVFTHTQDRGLKPRSLVRRVEVEPASVEVASRLRIEVGSPVYRYVRTRFVDEQALANQTNYMPYAVCPGLERDDVSRHSFQKLLESKYAAITVSMDEHFAVLPATDQDGEILGMAPGSSILFVDRLALSATGWPLVWANIRIRPDRYEYVQALWPRAAKLLNQ